jgi:hypothetical protein
MDRIGTRRELGVIRLAWATVLLVSPKSLIALFGGEDTPTSRLIGRILGVRHLLQGVVEIAFWPKGRRIGSLVDTAHAASAALFAARATRWRRAAGTDAAVAVSFAMAGAIRRSLLQPKPCPPN